MNMVNYEDTPLYVVYEMIRSLAERYGTYIVDSEIVGLTPAKAMIDCAEFYLKARDFDCHNPVSYTHLDVYKRQVQEVPHVLSIGEQPLGGGLLVRLDRCV